jgi:DNA-binding transcriptional regulator GbsR (MarR family)
MPADYARAARTAGEAHTDPDPVEHASDTGPASMPVRPGLPEKHVQFGPTHLATSALSELEIESIDLFISLIRLLGMPKSVGELYGLLFVSPVALPMEALMDRLQMSKGSASQGLKLLRSFGAVKTVYVAGDRRDHYIAEMDLSHFATNFIKGEVQPHLDSGLRRLDRMEKLVGQFPAENREIAENRLARLRHWHEKGQAMLPWLLKFLVS